MPLPSLIQASDTFNTWLDATNNVIAHIANTDAYVLVTNASSANLVATGNVYVNGAVHTTSLVANANVVLGGTSLGSSTPILKLNLGPANTNTVAIYGTNLSITMTNTVWSGADITVGPNTVFQANVTINAMATLTKNVALATSVLTVTTNSTVNTVSVGAIPSLTFNVNSTVTQVTTNSTVYTTHAANIFFTGTNLTLSSNTVTNGTLSTNNIATFGGNVSFSSNVTFNNAMVLGGPLAFGSSFVETATNLSGTGIAAPLSANANSVIHRITATDASSGYTGKVVAGIQQANTTQYRQLVLFNTGAVTLIFQHANTAAGANGVLCPGSTDFQIPGGGTCMLYYDVSVASGAKWRVVSAPIAVDATTTVSGYINTASQSFAGNKTFTGALNATSTFGVSGAVNALSTVGISGAVNALSTLGVSGALTVNGTVVVANTVDLNNSSSGRLVLPVGVDKWST